MKERLVLAVFLYFVQTAIFSLVTTDTFAATSGTPSQAIEIISPYLQQKVSALPLKVDVKFNEKFDTSSFQAYLNGKDITKKFNVSSNSANASLRIKDGLNASLGKLSVPDFISIKVRSTTSKKQYYAGQFFSIGPKTNADGSVKVIAPEGGKIALTEIGTVTFPAGAFSQNQQVKLFSTASTETDDEFMATSVMFSAGLRTPYEVRINTGKQQPSAPVSATFDLSPDFLAQVPGNSEVQIFAQIFQDGGEDILDSFELFKANFSEKNKQISVVLPETVFTNRRNADQTYEAIIVIGTTPTKPGTATQIKNSSISNRVEKQLLPPSDAILSFASKGLLNQKFTTANNENICKGSTLGSPLKSHTVTSPFDGKRHWGVDYSASDGTEVLASVDGKIKKIGFDERPLLTPDPRSGKKVKGWGNYVVLEHTDGSTTLYAHLESTTRNQGDSVKKGEVIAFSDNTGGSSGPHLHFEYAPNGETYDNPSKVDPDPCVNNKIAGSITVRDNGSLADDAFSVSINGAIVCTTDIGASNTCGIGNLRSGTAELTITAVTAPDDVGTYEITLSDGLKFHDGTISRSGTLPQGGAATFSINIP